MPKITTDWERGTHSGPNSQKHSLMVHSSREDKLKGGNKVYQTERRGGERGTEKTRSLKGFVLSQSLRDVKAKRRKHKITAQKLLGGGLDKNGVKREKGGSTRGSRSSPRE